MNLDTVKAGGNRERLGAWPSKACPQKGLNRTNMIKHGWQFKKMI
jgi:hypothetical protein